MIILSDTEIKTPRVSNLPKCKALPFVMQDKVGLDVCIRAYQDDDYMGIMTMYDDFEPKGIAMGLPPPDDEVRRRWVDDIVRTFFNILALHQKKIIGHAAIDILRTKFSPEYMIFLHQDFRCRGIGTQLTLTVKEICKECACKQVWLTVSTYNTCAITVFKKAGFHFSGPIESERDMVLELSRTIERTYEKHKGEKE